MTHLGRRSLINLLGPDDAILEPSLPKTLVQRPKFNTKVANESIRLISSLDLFGPDVGKCMVCAMENTTPEVLLGQPLNEKMDMWNVGIVVSNKSSKGSSRALCLT